MHTIVTGLVEELPIALMLAPVACIRPGPGKNVKNYWLVLDWFLHWLQYLYSGLPVEAQLLFQEKTRPAENPPSFCRAVRFMNNDSFIREVEDVWAGYD